MAVRETLELDLRGALAQIGTLEKEIQELRRPVVIPIDVKGAEQIHVTAAEYRQIVRSMEEGVSPSRAIADATGELQRSATLAESDFRDLAKALDVSEDEARNLAREILEGRDAALRTVDAAKDVARQMGLSEDEAARFSKEMGTAANRTDDVNRGASNAAGGLEKMRAGFSRLIIAAAAFVGIRELARFANDSIQAFSTLQESTSKAEVVFGRFADTVFEFTRNAPGQLGATRAAAIEAASTFGNLFLSVGLGQDTAAEMSTTLIQLATDLASFNNISVAEATEKIQSGLVGQAEPLRTVGVLLSEAAVAAKGFELGLGGATGKLSEAEKVQARYAIILDQTTTAQGDFARTSEGIANSQRTAAALFGELKTAVGEGLAPAYAELIKLAPEVFEGFENMIPAIAAAALALGDFFKPKPGQADLLDIIGFLTDLPRGFGQITDTVGLAAGAVGGFNMQIAAWTRFDFAGVEKGMQGVTDAAADFNQTTTERVGTQSLIDDLRAGVEPALAFANALAFVGRDGIISPQTVKNYLAIARVDTRQARLELQRLIDMAEELGLSGDDVKALEDALFDLNAELFEGARGNADYLASIQGIRGATEEATPALLSQATALFLLRTEADLLGISLSEVLAGGAEQFPELAGLIGSLEPATANLGLAQERLDTFAATFETTNVRISDAIDELGKLPEALKITKDQFLANLEISAEEEAQFQLDIIKLFKIDEELATQLAGDPRNRDIVSQFLGDAVAAERAGDIIRGAAEDLTGDIVDEVRTAIETSDLDEQGKAALELLLEGMGNTVVAEAGVAALAVLLQQEVDKMKFTINSSQFSFEAGGEPFLGGGIAGAAPGGGGGVTINNTVNYPAVGDVPTAVAQMNQSTSAVGASLNRIARQ